MARERSEFSGAMLASTLLHAGVIVAAMISWPWARQLPMGAAVPVNIVANAPSTNLAPAEQGPEELPAQTEAPVPDAPAPLAPHALTVGSGASGPPVPGPGGPWPAVTSEDPGPVPRGLRSSGRGYQVTSRRAGLREVPPRRQTTSSGGSASLSRGRATASRFRARVSSRRASQTPRQ